ARTASRYSRRWPRPQTRSTCRERERRSTPPIPTRPRGLRHATAQRRACAPPANRSDSATAVHIVDIVVLCVAAVVLLGCAIILARQRFMLRAPGSLPVAMRPAPAARWQYGVARYAGGELRWY